MKIVIENNLVELTPESVEIPVQAIREIAAGLPPSRY